MIGLYGSLRLPYGPCQYENMREKLPIGYRLECWLESMLEKYIKDKRNLTDPVVRQNYGIMGSVVGIACNVLLCVLKVLAGLLTGAVSVTADGLNNLSDAVSSIVMLAGFRMAEKPADLEHPFGHGRIEYLAGLFVSIGIVLMGYELLLTSVDKILHPEMPEFSILMLLILALSIGAKLMLSWFQSTIGMRIASNALKAAAKDSLGDCVSTGAVLLGMLVTFLTGKNIDGFAGLFVAVFIMAAGFISAKETIQPLMGEIPNGQFVRGVYEEVRKERLVLGIHDMMVHDYGPGRRIVSLHAEVPYNVDLLTLHDAIDNVEMGVRQKFQCEITIHMDPIVTDDRQIRRNQKMVEKLVKEMNRNWRVHDFRMVPGDTHTNLIFDLAVPALDVARSAEISKAVRARIHEENENYVAVIRVEQEYVVIRNQEEES